MIIFRRRSLFSFILIVILSIVGVLLLFVISRPLPNRAGNGFERIWLLKEIESQHIFSTTSGLKKICGVTDHSIFFSTRDPRYLIRRSWTFGDWDTLYVPVRLSQEIISAFSFSVDSPYVFLFANSIPAVISGRIRDSRIVDLSSINLPTIFTRSVPLDSSEVIIRTFDTTTYRQIFQRIDLSSGVVTSQSDVITGQDYGGFETDGSLNYDKVSSRLTFVQKYQNRFFVFNKDIAEVSTGRSIDTFFHNLTKLSQIRWMGKDRIAPSRARMDINRDSYASHGIIYVQSNLRADNESSRDFRRRFSLDLYRIEDGTYLGSIGVNILGRQRPISFIIRNESLILLFPDAVGVYSMTGHQKVGFVPN